MPRLLLVNPSNPLVNMADSYRPLAVILFLHIAPFGIRGFTGVFGIRHRR